MKVNQQFVSLKNVVDYYGQILIIYQKLLFHM